MVKMSGIIACCCGVLFFLLTSVSAVQRLNSINDLRRIDFSQSVPAHILLLLYWFANTVDIGYNDVITFNFNPSEDYGAHHYGNFEGLLDPLPWGCGYQYYTVGSLNQEASSRKLPDYVQHPRREYDGNNRDRIIIRVREQTIDEVYITQHIQDQGNYDPAHTYMITTDLLRQIREFSVGQDQQSPTQLRNRYGSDVYNMRITRGNPAGLELLLSIVIQERHSSNQYNNRTEYTYRPQSNYRPDHTHRPESNYRPQYNYRPENTRNDWDESASVMCILLLLIIVVALFFLGILQKR